jgi:hypothetical protein
MGERRHRKKRRVCQTHARRSARSHTRSYPECADAPAFKIGEGPKPGLVGIADAQHFAKLIVGNCRRHRRASHGCIFDAAEANLRIAPLDRLIDRGESDVDELGYAIDLLRNSSAISTSKPTSRSGWRGSASTKALRPPDRRPAKFACGLRRNEIDRLKKNRGYKADVQRSNRLAEKT